MFHFSKKYTTILVMRDNSIKVSIIIPVYNTSQYLPKCLDSLTNQTLGDIEIICVNDGSKDNSLKILNKYANKDSRIKIISQENQGQSTARNNGILTAKGEFIGFIDSDDFADLTMFEKLYNDAKSKESDISMCSICVLNEKTGMLTTKDPYMNLDLFDESFENKSFDHKQTLDFIFRICVTPWNKIYKRSFLLSNNILFPSNLNYEDNVFFYETFIQAKCISIVKEPLVFYRRESETSYTFGNHDHKKLDFFKVFEKIEELLKEKGIYNELKDYFLTYKKNTLIYWYKKLNNAKVKQEYYDKLNQQYTELPF